MQIQFKTNKIRKICCDKQYSTKKYGNEMWNYISLRITQIRASSSIEEMLSNRIGGCHSLKGDRQGQYAFHLKEPNRLIVVKLQSTIENTVEIIEIVDYH